MAKTAMSQLEDQVELIRREAFAAGYAAAMQAVHEIASRPAPAEKPPTRTAPVRHGRPPRQPQPAPREAQARRAPVDSKPTAKRLERGSNARFVEEALRARPAGGPPGRDPRRPAARQRRGIGLYVDPPCAWAVGGSQSG